jgi:inner membrane protein
MDNLAHALVGAAVGRAIGGGRVPRAAWLGAVAANAPDWAELFLGWPWPRAQYLAEHRGITHALVGCAVETVALTLATVLALRWWARRRRAVAPSPLAVGALMAAAVASHPLMDWQGSYGLRPFLPWSDRWYYGDFVAIVDAFYWIVPLVALAWGGRRHWLPLLGYAALWLPAALLVLLTDAAAPWVKAAWIAVTVAGMAGWSRHWFGPARARLAAGAAVGALALYAAAQLAASLPAKAAIRREARSRFGPAARWAALTTPGRPFSWEPMIAGPDTVAGPGWATPRHLDLPVVRRAVAATADGRDIARFARFLAADVDSTGPGDAPRVRLRDVRYGGRDGRGWAAVTVTLD